MAYSVLLDACVLVPSHLRDVLLESAGQGAYRPVWSNVIEYEVTRAVARIRESRGADRDAIDRANDRLLAQMEIAFPDARVEIEDPTSLTKLTYSPDPHDNHVVVAAILGRADQIVTFNLRDFPVSALPRDLEVKHPDEFLLDLYGLDPELIFHVLEAVAARSGRKGPRLDASMVLAKLEPSVPEFVAAASQAVDSSGKRKPGRLN